ncbi:MULTISPECIES: hypothetical protein [unclassified Streptomyces]|uniref:hypothetical protein n=1 Tax=unclassified Streptomyces TaxID=2593676 RepID=UPI00365D26DA
MTTPSSPVGGTQDWYPNCTNGYGKRSADRRAVQRLRVRLDIPRVGVLLVHVNADH